VLPMKTSGPSRLHVLVVAALVPALATSTMGCSAMMSRPPPDHPMAEERECSRARAPEIVDAIAGGVTGGVALVLLGAALIGYESRKDDVQASWAAQRIEPDTGLVATGALGVAAGVGLLASAKYGRESARACDAARAELRRRQAPPWLQPSPWTPPPTPPGSPPPPAWPLPSGSPPSPEPAPVR